MIAAMFGYMDNFEIFLQKQVDGDFNIVVSDAEASEEE